MVKFKFHFIHYSQSLTFLNSFSSCFHLRITRKPFQSIRVFILSNHFPLPPNVLLKSSPLKCVPTLPATPWDQLTINDLPRLCWIISHISYHLTFLLISLEKLLASSQILYNRPEKN